MKNSPFKQVLAIINPAAGQEQPILHTLNRVFADTGVDWQIALTKGQGDAAREAAQAAASGIDVVAVYGGDGTVLEVANALYDTKVPIAILPGGTANMLAFELNVPVNLEGAVQLITDPSTRIRSVDMGRVDDRLFFHLSAGLIGNIANRTNRADKDQRGILAYILSGLKELEDMPSPALFKLTLDEEEVEVDGVGCMVTNLGKIGIADLRLAHDIDMSDGILDVMVIRDIDLSTLIKALSGALASGEIGDALWHRRVRKTSIIVPPEMHIMLDGEPYNPTSALLSIHVVPCAASFLVPPAKDD